MTVTAHSSMTGFVAWEAEDSFADAADDTYTTRIQVRDDAIDVSGLQRALLDRGGTFQRFGEGDAMVPGPFGVSTFKTTLDAYGHGSATNGALTEPNLAKLLAHVFGNSVWSQVGGLLTTGTNDANTLTSTNTTLLAGGLIRVGAKGDTRADGQGSVAAGASSPYELDVDLPGAPTTADAVRAMGLIYPISDPTSGILTSSAAASNNSLRFVLATANLQFAARGCACTRAALTGIGPGGYPRWELDWGSAHWNPVSQTYPSATATADKAPAPVANGSLFIQAKGTTTRATYEPRDISFEIGHEIVPIRGPGGENTGQDVVGWVRVPRRSVLNVTLDAEAVTASPTWHTLFATDPNSITMRHILYTMNTVDGRALALYLPNARPIGQVPSQSRFNDMNTVTLQFEALTNTVTTNALTLSAWRLGMG